MTSRDFNRLVADASRNQPLRGVHRRDGGNGPHHWKTRAQLVAPGKQFGNNPLTGEPYFSASVFGSAEPRGSVRVFVEPGTVNDQMAAITYLRERDPRGWNMPEDYPGSVLAEKIYGADYQLLDRPLTERVEPPHLLLDVPAASDSADTGDFERVLDAQRRQPAFFRSQEMWDRELYRASIFLTAEPARYTRVETRSHFPLVSRSTRFRVTAAPHLPANVSGAALGQKELARLFLTRKKTAQGFVDQIYVQQRCFWSLWTANTYPGLALLEATAEAAALVNLAVLPLGAGGLAIGTALLAAEALLADILLADIAADFESARTAEFWTAA